MKKCPRAKSGLSRNRLTVVAAFAIVVIVLGASYIAIREEIGRGRQVDRSSSLSFTTSTISLSGTYPIIVDFASGRNHSYPIPSPFFGVGGIGNQGVGSSSATLQALLQAGLEWSRGEAQLPLIFSNSSEIPDYSSIDDSLQIEENNGFTHIIMLLDYTPLWLTNNNTGYPCSTYTHYPPSNYTLWGKLAAEIVKHIDQRFHFPVVYYEIWNEPDGGDFLCVNALSRESVYFSIFSAAAQAIRNQGYSGVVKIGGPVLAQPTRDSQMIYDFLHNSSTYPYVDFVSYHQYALLNRSDSWDAEPPEVYETMQDVRFGYSAIYDKIATIVHHGLQPGAASTPIFITEYNTNAAGPTCCSNSPIFAPLYNALFVTDILGTVYSPGSDRSLPLGVTYFSLSSPLTGFCMVGSWDQSMDCSILSSPEPSPYPSYYAYVLLGSPRYLGMNGGAYLAISANTSLNQVSVLAFYTASTENILLVNAGPSSYQSISILIKNAVGSNLSSGELYSIVYNQQHSNESITGQQISLNYLGSGNYVANNIDLQAYKVIGISIPYYSSR